MLTPLIFAWDGEAMIPAPHSRRLIDQHFVIGEKYQFVIHEERSAASHNHYFALLKKAWENLPEAIAADFPSVEHARKRALIMTGHRHERQFVASSKAEALRLAAFLRPASEYAVVVADGAVVTEMTAKSQSMRAMGKADFQRSKDDVLAYLAKLGGYDASQLGRAA